MIFEPSIDAYVTVQFRANNLIDEDTLKDVFGDDLGAWVRELVAEEGLYGVVEDKFEIVSVERIPENIDAN